MPFGAELPDRKFESGKYTPSTLFRSFFQMAISNHSNGVSNAEGFKSSKIGLAVMICNIYPGLWFCQIIKGPESFAKFFPGKNRERAFDIFQKPKGKDKFSEKNILYIDFIETSEGLPVNLKMITCALNQLAENCRFITKELLKLNILEEAK